ncbi:Unknown protein sequence [Pseudomonas savastanoi pv. glycinea]|uniref:Transcriptional regulator, HxlR family n=1 Tax=Pseudomonas savastanoi pv. glycinea TaxID=318 RepID=A0A3M4EPU0_PSESG|nr:Unknown protein sequence [Pseudomonas savastanoi pv. glycinea]KPC46403.1 Unknown protein sequence [Pseudomonas savastanoi pv. glycinea]RML30229.1 Transcriptional regulator, HxlR family [Pseudomonas savastanoi pv. glycinea]RMM74029.1 Transcriptional regulator, HxlR family [Pseudomonas savastanoi pv. glycinea]RMM89510.1 Transcriptional regulator, HxlR family [Pseudomonas savastanoi pv. glycinea]
MEEKGVVVRDVLAKSLPWVAYGLSPLGLELLQASERN